MSFDAQSPGTRVSDWTETASGTAVPIVTGYTFDGSNLPVADYDYTFGALLTSSPSAQLRIHGVRHGGTSYGVFVNALQLVASPVIRITAASVAADGNLQLTIQAQFPGQGLAFEESADLPAWRGEGRERFPLILLSCFEPLNLVGWVESAAGCSVAALPFGASRRSRLPAGENGSGRRHVFCLVTPSWGCSRWGGLSF